MSKKKELTFKQRKAIYLLISCNQDEEEVADYLGISLGTLRKWQKEKHFAEKLEQRFQELELVDSSFRKKQNQQLMKAVYEEIHKRVVTGAGFHKTNIKTLVNFIKTLSYELRLDTSGEYTAKNKTEHVMDDIIDRYEKNEVTRKTNLRLIEPPTRSKKEKKYA